MQNNLSFTQEVFIPYFHDIHSTTKPISFKKHRWSNK